MKKTWTALLCAAACLLSSARAESHLDALRQETAGGWHQTYTTAKGQALQIDAAILLPDNGQTVASYQVNERPALDNDRLSGYGVRSVQSDSISLVMPADPQQEEKQNKSLGKFQESRRYGRTVPEIQGLSYQEACQTAEGVINALFDRTLADYALDFGEVATWENGQTFLLCFAPRLNGLPVSSDSLTLDYRGRDHWYALVPFHDYQEVEADLELVSFATVQENVLASLEAGKAEDSLGMSQSGPIASITQVQLEYALFTQKGKQLLPVWAVDFETAGQEGFGRMYFSAQTGKPLVWNGNGYQTP